MPRARGWYNQTMENQPRGPNGPVDMVAPYDVALVQEVGIRDVAAPQATERNAMVRFALGMMSLPIAEIENLDQLQLVRNQARDRMAEALATIQACEQRMAEIRTQEAAQLHMLHENVKARAYAKSIAD